MSDALDDRRTALEESFFDKENKKLLEKLKAENQKKLDRDAISRLSGITQDAVIDRLLSLNLNAQTIAALSLFPLIDVAWADGAVDAKEKTAVLEAAEKSGASKGTPAYELVSNWLAQQPTAAIRSAWTEYVQAMGAKLSAADKLMLKNELLGRAREVAESSGGILGMGNKVSKSEADALARLEKAFA